MMTIPEPAVTPISQEDIQKKKKIEKEVAKVIKEIVEQVEFVLSSGPHYDYFLGHQSKKQKLKQMNSKYSNIIQSKLFLEIQSGLTKVSKDKKSYIIEAKQKPTIDQIIQKDKNQIKLKKKHAIEALNQVLKQENQLVKYQRGLRESRSHTKSQVYAQENPQWRTQLKQAIKRQRELDRSFQIKSQQAQNRAILAKEQAQKAKLETIQKQRANHLRLLQERKKRQSILREQQREYRSKCHQFVQKTKPKKYRFQVLSEKGEQKLKILEQQREQKIKQYKQMRQKYDWGELKEHESKYFQTMSEKRQQWIQKFESSLSRVNKRHNKSIFAQKIEQEENQKELEERLKANKKRQFLQKIRQYGASVLQNHMPRKFIKSTNYLINNENKTVRNSLNRFEQRQRGLAFLNEAKKQRKLTHQINNNKLKAVSSLPTIKAPTYKDYLRQQPKRIKQGSTFSTLLTQKKGEWASNAKSIIQKIDVTNKKDDKNLLESAFKKIQLLKAIM